MGATIFAGSKVKHLKAEAQLLSGASRISGTVDPTSSAVTAEPGSIYQNTSTGAIYKKLDSGSSTNWVQLASGSESGINYVTNPGAESNTTGWATYDDGAVSRPVNATGGTASNVTWSRSTTTPLRGLADFNFVKGAADAQGEGVSFDFAIASADKGKLLGVEFECELISGTYSSGSTSADSDLVIVIHDVTNAVNLEPIPLKLSLPIVGVTSKFYATFPASSNSTSYRLAVHCATTSASAYTVGFDSFVVAPVKTINQVPMTDWVEYTPTLNNITLGTGSTIRCRWRRVGDTMHVQAYFILGVGGDVTGIIGISLPSGYTADTSKFSDNNSNITGSAWASDASAATYFLGASHWAENRGFVEFLGHNITSVWATFAPFDWTQGDDLSGEAFIPIAGWSSSVTTVAPQVQGGTVGVRVQGQPTGTLNGSFNKVTYPTIVSDTAGTYSSGVWTVPVTGYYDLGAGVSIIGDVTTSSDLEFIIFNTTTSTTIAYTSKRFAGTLTGAFLQSEQIDRKFVLLQAGETYEVRIAVTSIANISYSSNATTSYFSASLVSAVQVVPADSKSRNVKSVTASFSVLPTDDVILGNATGGNITATLPAAASSVGLIKTFKKTDASGNTIIADGSGSETIDGATTKTISTQYDQFSIISDGTSWHVI